MKETCRRSVGSGKAAQGRERGGGGRGNAEQRTAEEVAFTLGGLSSTCTRSFGLSPGDAYATRYASVRTTAFRPFRFWFVTLAGAFWAVRWTFRRIAGPQATGETCAAC